MFKDSFKARERAFEATYFARINAELVEKIHTERDAKIQRGLLATATGIKDESLLQRILDLGVAASNVQVLSLAPLVWVAWATGSLTLVERKTALDAAEAEGVCKESLSHQLFEAWLDEPPGPVLFNTWRDYVHAVLEQLDERARAGLRDALLGRVRSIASASGGLLGIGKTSKREKEVLEEIEVALTWQEAAS
jgi:hypothetical protein